MDFYTRLADYYDTLFAPSPEQKQWALNFASDLPVLDAGCGTGELVLYLSGQGRNISGFDFDPRMINLARAKAENLPAPPVFTIASLQNCGAGYSGQVFGTLLCLGNTLVHVKNGKELLGVAQNFYGLLAPGGKLAVQLLNYDRIFRFSIQELPPLKAVSEETEIGFYRSYRRDEADPRGLVFGGKLRIRKKEGTEEWSGETRLYAAGREEISTALKKAGFKAITVLEDYNETPAGPDSPVYLITAVR